MNCIIKIFLKNFPRDLLISISVFLNPILDFFFKGSKFHDPINNKTYRKFLPYGYNKIRDNALSPGTLSLERHRLLWLYLQNETNFMSSEIKLLHIAPEQCFYKIFKKSKKINYTTFDLESPIADIKGDICNMPFEDNFFDLVLCNHVLEHIVDDELAMKEIFRVVKPKGTAILQVPIDISNPTTIEDYTIKSKKERNEKFGQYDHVRLYGKDYFDKLKSVGFHVEQNTYVKSLDSEEIAKYSLNINEIIPVCIKLI